MGKEDRGSKASSKKGEEGTFVTEKQGGWTPQPDSRSPTSWYRWLLQMHERRNTSDAFKNQQRFLKSSQKAKAELQRVNKKSDKRKAEINAKYDKMRDRVLDARDNQDNDDDETWRAYCCRPSFLRGDLAKNLTDVHTMRVRELEEHQKHVDRVRSKIAKRADLGPDLNGLARKRSY